MKSTSISKNDIQLKVFQDDTSGGVESEIFDQLPLLKDLTQRFESVTGWQLNFSETLASYQSRCLVDRDQSILGRLEITDLSEKLEIGTTARHRGYCDQLAETLNSMVNTIQLDRQRFRESGISLNPVVQPPFDWWGLAGNSGLAGGRIANWCVSSTEKLQLFFSDFAANGPGEVALAGAAMLATFETACQTIGDIYQYAPLFPGVIAKTCEPLPKLNSFGTIELDPITGEYQLDGFNASNRYLLIDVDAGTVIRPKLEELDGILYSGQILAVGLDETEGETIQQSIAGIELNVGHCLTILEKNFSNSAAIFLYRK